MDATHAHEFLAQPEDLREVGVNVAALFAPEFLESLPESDLHEIAVIFIDHT